jgi:predicted O-methyltransferase YrrM
MGESSGVGQPATLEDVRRQFGELPYMTYLQACRLRDFLTKHSLKNCLELGFFHGLSSAYIAAALAANGGGHLTTVDLLSVRRKSPNIEDLLRQLSLTTTVTVVYEPRSYTWRLMKLIARGDLERFDFCYIDGGHSWDVSGFGFFLVEKLLRPGGWVLFDDLNWTSGVDADRYRRAQQPLPGWLARQTEEELHTEQVRKVWELLVKQHPGFDQFYEEGEWGFARKSG